MSQRALIIWCSMITLVLLPLYGAYWAGFRVNVSASMPVGIWRVEKLKRPLRRGDIVWFCPPDTKVFRMAKKRGYIPAGDCPGGYAHLIKRVVAIAGDKVQMTDQGVKVNGVLLPNSKAKQTDKNGQSLPQLDQSECVLGSGSVWLMTGNSKSFDGRYYGATQISMFYMVVYPLLIRS